VTFGLACARPLARKARTTHPGPKCSKSAISAIGWKNSCPLRRRSRCSPRAGATAEGASSHFRGIFKRPRASQDLACGHTSPGEFTLAISHETRQTDLHAKRRAGADPICPSQEKSNVPRRASHPSSGTGRRENSRVELPVACDRPARFPTRPHKDTTAAHRDDFKDCSRSTNKRDRASANAMLGSNSTSPRRVHPPWLRRGGSCIGSEVVAPTGACSSMANPSACASSGLSPNVGNPGGADCASANRASSLPIKPYGGSVAVGSEAPNRTSFMYAAHGMGIMASEAASDAD